MSQGSRSARPGIPDPRAPREGLKELSGIDRIAEACSRLNGGLSGEALKTETRRIQEIAFNLHSLAYRTRLLAQKALRLVDSDLPLETLQNVLTDAISLLGARRGQILIRVEESETFDRLPSIGSQSEPDEIEGQFIDAVAGRAYETNQPVLNPDPSGFPELESLPGLDRFSDAGVLAVPLSIETDGRDERIGVLYLETPPEKGAIADTDIWIVQFLGSLTALSIRNIRLTASLRMAYQETVHALVRALEAKDPYTRGHSERVAEYSERCGKHFELGQARLKTVYSAALLHDIGKIGIRESVLNKPSKLTPDEYDHIKKHPMISEAILHGLTFLTEENTILKQHHERYDGKGYPYGLKGDEISLEGAIIQVADAWDAMTSRRVYRKELDLKIALEELREHSGSQFSPRVVEMFVRMVREDGLVPVEEIEEEQ